MNTKGETRIDASQVDPKQLDQLLKVLEAPQQPALVSQDNIRTDLPQPIFELLLHIVQMMRKGRAVALLPQDETFTTQAAANYLGVSRQFLVNQLKEGEIPYHRTGTHRRLSYKDLVAYDEARQQNRSKTLKSLFDRLREEGVYDAEVMNDDAG